jgi:hypothetical protein
MFMLFSGDDDDFSETSMSFPSDLMPENEVKDAILVTSGDAKETGNSS